MKVKSKDKIRTEEYFMIKVNSSANLAIDQMCSIQHFPADYKRKTYKRKKMFLAILPK